MTIRARGRAAALLVACTSAALLASSSPQQESSTFRLLFIGHEIGLETDVVTRSDVGTRLDASFGFVDRGTSVDLSGTLDESSEGEPTHLLVKGRSYRLFSSDAEVTRAGAVARVRDRDQSGDIAIGTRPFFPVDNYPPVGVQERLIRYWLSHGRPAEIVAPPAGTVRITSRGRSEGGLERLAVDGVVWGTETAWVDAQRNLIALTTWAGALPFEAIRPGWVNSRDRFIAEAVRDRMTDLATLARAAPVVHSGSYALVGATVIDGTGRPPIPRAAIIITDNRIAAVGPADESRIPAQMPRVDVTGLTIIPGLWDMHAHASQVDWAPAYLASGVTTIRDMGGEEAFLVAVRDAIDSGRGLGPRYLLAGLIDGPGPHAFGATTAATPDEARAHVNRYRRERFDEIKIYTDVKPDVVTAAASEAHRLGMTVTGHVPQGMTAQSAVEAGFDGIAHMQLRGAPGSAAVRQQLQFFKAHGTVMDPTQSWNELGGHPSSVPIDRFLPGMARLPRPLARMFASMSAGDGDAEAVHNRLIDSVRLLKEAVDAGLLVVAGTDKGVPGLSLPRELELDVEAGMTPLEALQTATIMPARAVKRDRESGTIEPGKRADLVVLGGNPLDRISHVRDTRLVVANGRMYDCDRLWALAGFLPPDHTR